MALAPWRVLGGGKFRTDAEEEARRASGEKGRTIPDPDWERNDDEKKMSYALVKVAAEVGVKSITAGESASVLCLFQPPTYFFQVAIAYVMQKVPYVFPIIGGRKVEHLLSNLEALDVALSAEQIEFLENVFPLDPGFPTSMIVSSNLDASGISDLLWRFWLMK